MSRDAFLNRVRDAAQAGNAFQVRVRDDLPPQVGYCGAGDDLPARLALEITAVGGHPELVTDWTEARDAVGKLLDHYAARTVLCWQHPVLERLGLPELLTARHVEKHNFESLRLLAPSERRERMLLADVGISSVSLAVAETGTLALASQPGQERVASLLPPVHIAVVSAEQIVPDLFDLFARLEQQLHSLPSNLVLITGPSKTGDLELRLTTGVHGPGDWHVVIVR